MDFLERNGAREAAGMRLHQQDFSDRVQIPRRTLVEYLKKMEGYGLISVTRTTVDGSFGAPRAPNIYRLLMSFEQWEERVEHIIRERLSKIDTAKSAAGRQNAADVKAGRAVRTGRAGSRPASRVPVPDEVIDAAAGAYEHVSDDDLYGW